MVPLITIIAILVIHYIGDFYLQTHKMATNKSKSLYWLTLHVLTYTATLFFVGAWFSSFNFETYILFVLINGGSHWIVDFFTSKLTRYLWKKEEWHKFFLVIGLDQLIHYLTIFITYILLYG